MASSSMVTSGCGFVHRLMLKNESSAFDAHHQQARFSWNLGAQGAEPQVVGSDVAVIATDGRISTVLGFLDKVPG